MRPASPARLQQGYGLTEASPVTHVTPLWEEHRPGTVGELFPNTEARLVEPGPAPTPRRRAWRAVGSRAAGDGRLPRGRGRDGAHARRRRLAAHRRHRHLDGDGWRIVDRLKELIKFKGYQVPPAMLEALLLTHPAVADACVIPVADEDAGRSRRRSSCRGKPARELMAFVAERVAPHERVRALELIDEIPKSPSGKLLRRVLVERERERRRVNKRCQAPFIHYGRRGDGGRLGLGFSLGLSLGFRDRGT